MNRSIVPQAGAERNTRKGDVRIHPLDAAALCVLSSRLPGSAGANPTVLCLDLGQRMGWALRDGDGQVTSGVAELRTDRWQSGGIRFLKLKRWLADVKEAASGIDLVLYEQVRAHAGVDAAHAYGGWLATLTPCCEQSGIPYEGVPVDAIIVGE